MTNKNDVKIENVFEYDLQERRIVQQIELISDLSWVLVCSDTELSIVDFGDDGMMRVLETLLRIHPERTAERMPTILSWQRSDISFPEEENRRIYQVSSVSSFWGRCLAKASIRSNLYFHDQN
ncbi:hypothetical protein AXF42_Ash000134 [Apostasia shenzhenica]|uniref:Uncharacterized protein n=1 Tax=Apostasia shenzhenica TaxID=1088818 RepID=A0A2I0AFH4_9ASPA|nr:hypothetical protein AXF42_Ash000134 [Apostasia shenzhenica]